MNRFIALATAALVGVVVLIATALPASGMRARSSSAAGNWQRLPSSPVVPDFGSAQAVWTGTRMLVFGHDTLTALDARGAPYAKQTVNVAATYNPVTKAWRRLSPPRAADAVGGDRAVWTGKEMLVLSASFTVAYNPSTNHWRRLPHGHGGLVVWTDREALAWGGGCCGDAFSDGVAYNPASNTWRKLAASPLAGSQQPVGAWTGRELIVLVGGNDPDGKPWPARLARAAAYNPATGAWRRIAPLPVALGGANAAWDGHELLVVGSTAARRPFAFAYDPATNHWRRLASMPSARTGASAVWTGDGLLLFGGTSASGKAVAGGLSYDPSTNRWSSLPRSPLPARLQATAIWTGHAMIVWGGVPTSTWGKYVAAGAVFTPAAQ